MKHFKLYLILLGFIGMSFSGYGQSVDLRKADDLLKAFKYVKAAKAYKDVFDKTNSVEALSKLANVYKLMGKGDLAENLYAQLVGMDGAQPEDLLNYAMSLMSNGNYSAASQYAQQYASMVPSDARVSRLLSALSNIDVISADNGACEVKNVGADVNTEFDDFGPMWYGDGIVFASDRGDGTSNTTDGRWGTPEGNCQTRTGPGGFSSIYEGTGRPYLDMYYSDGNACDNSTVRKFAENLNTRLHEAYSSFSADGNTMYFTRDNLINSRVSESSDDIVKLKIYTAENVAGAWVARDELPFNDDEYNTMHPALSADGNALYFSSDMPGGYGSSDIYVSYRVGSSWGRPENLGPDVNTEGREQFPYLASDGTLYFSSDGWGGLGDLDIYSASLDNGVWSGTTNLGAPINSSKDDFGLIIDDSGSAGYLTSRRTGGYGNDDIYCFSCANQVSLCANVTDCDTGVPVSGASVNLTSNGEIVDQAVVDADGNACFMVDPCGTYTVSASSSSYTSGDSKSATACESTNVDLCLRKPPVVVVDEPPVYVPPVACTLSGYVYISGTTTPVPGASVTLTELGTNSSQTAIAGSDGYYSFSISQESDYRITASSPNYLSGGETASSRGMDCTYGLSKNVFLSNIPCQIVLEHIYYDLDKYYIREDAKPELDKIVRLMQENPSISAELGSHTDCRASDAYNNALSQKRAQAAVDYIVSRGISSSRLQARGYGETQLTNGCDCETNTGCSEEQHQANRRTTFQILGSDCDGVYSVDRYDSGWLGGYSSGQTIYNTGTYEGGSWDK